MKKVVFLLLASIMLLSACKKDNDSIENPDGTIDVSKISLTTLTPKIGIDNIISTGGKVSIDLNKYERLAYGVCYSKSKNPSHYDESKGAVSFENGEYITIIDDLVVISPQTKYYIRAYILNIADGSVKYGNEISVILEPAVYDNKNVNGKYVGIHFLNIPASLLESINATLALDSTSGEVLDLSKGFLDTLDFRVVNNDEINITSSFLGTTLNGKLSASNTVKFDENKFDIFDFSSDVKAENVSISSYRDLKFTSAAIDSTVNIELLFKASKIGSLTIPLAIPTKGTFTKIAN